MLSTFADIQYMVAILTKSEASEGFAQIIDFLNGSYIKYALTVNPHIYVSCIKQFWNIVTVKQSNDVTRLQALVDIKKVVLLNAVIRDVLRLNNAEGVDCLPNEEIFAGLARMGYEKPSTKLTFYKIFFSSQWKFPIYTILQSMSAKRTSWNEFSSAIASAVIYLSTGRKFNFSKYIFESLVRNVNSSSKFYMYPRFIQLIIQNQIGDLSSHTTKYTSPSLTQKVFANIRRVGKDFSGVETPLFKGILVVGENVEEGIAEERVQDVAPVAAAQDGVSAAIEEDVQEQSIPSPTPRPQPHDLPSTLQRINTSDDTIMEDVSNQGRMIDELDRDEGVALMGVKEEKRKLKRLRIFLEDEPAKVEEVVEVVTSAKLIREVVTIAKAPVSTASTTIPAAGPQVPATTPTAVPVRVAAASTKKRNKVVIWDPEEASTIIKPTDTKSKDKGKGKMVEEPKLMKKKQQVEFDKEISSQVKGIDRRAIESINETSAEKAAKRNKLNEEVAELHKHLEIVPDEDNDVFTEATSLDRKVSVVDYSIIHLNNKPHYKIVKADGTHQSYVSFLTLLKNFDRDDLKSLWSIVKETFSTTKPDNFTDDFFLTTLGAMFEKEDDQA
uniref:Synaptobrevin, longin-like domain protein n=1 Tax=Tanacetum cinerariifolium TaxID=118510 RepID=A0A6L2M996_TANCI|nr:hypothetical protein [Tanacetum cinerariifolium]